MRIAVCDDDKTWRDIIAGYLDSIKGIELEYSLFESGEELVETYQQQGHMFDIVYLDIEMADMNGIKTANFIRKRDRHVVIVFITNHDKYMYESFECLPFRFLLKPIDENDFKKVFFKIVEMFSEERSTLSVIEGRKIIRLLSEEIKFLESVDHKTYIHTTSEQHTTYTPLSKIKEKLNPALFVQIHRSYIVNLDHVRSVSKNELYIMEYDYSLPIGDKYRSDFEQKLLLLEERRRFL